MVYFQILAIPYKWVKKYNSDASIYGQPIYQRS